MSDTHSAETTGAALASPLAPSRHAIQRKTASAPLKVTGKLAVALKRIIEHGEDMDEAATQAGLTTRAVRLALEKPHVVQWMKAEREVFRAYVCAQNIHHAKKMRDTAGNAMAQLGAMKLIEQIGDDPQHSQGAVRSPGFVIVVNTGSQPADNAKPLIELHSEPRED